MAVVNGKWLISEDPFYSFPSGTDEITETVNFDAGGASYVKIKVFDGTANVITFYPNGDVSGIEAYHYRDGAEYADGWRVDGYRTLDFGTSPQEVSSAFGQWLSANATRIHDEPDDPETPPKAIYGTWQWNDSIATAPSEEFYLNITFTNGSGDKFYSLKVDKNADGAWTIVYGNAIVYNFQTKQWSSEKHRVLNFGSSASPTYVSAKFYDWFITCASEVPMTVMFGTWMFNDVIRRIDLSEVELDVCRFISNHRMFNKMTFSGDYNEILYDDVLVYTDTSGWLDPEYKKVYFEEDLLSIFETIWYSVLTLNTVTSNDKPTIRGVWDLVDTVNVQSNMEQTVKFKVNSDFYNKLSAGTTKIMYDDTVVYENGWIGDVITKRLDFGTDIQTVEKKFLFWLIDNAVKVSLYLIEGATLTEIADAIRRVSGVTSNVAANKIAVKDLAEAIQNVDIPTAFTDEELDAIMEAVFAEPEESEEEINE